MMHLDAEHPLFFERRQPLWLAAASLGLTVSVLVLNAGAKSTTLSLVGATVAAVLILVARVGGRQRTQPALGWTLGLVILVLLGGAALNADAGSVVEAGARVLCGVLWILWLGTQLDWGSLRQILLRLRLPAGIAAALDRSLLHGVLTQREWSRRRDAARVRLGSASLPVSSWGSVLGEGALQAFLRLERVEENALLLSCSRTELGAEAGVGLEGVDVERGGQRVLEALELRLRPAEWLLLCGPSGVGKSSLLRLLAGLDGPAKGTLSRFGVFVDADTPLRARLDGRVALLGQNPEHHFIASTAGEDIAWGLLRRGVHGLEAERRSLEMARAMRIAHLWERPCHALSFGEQRRVALAGLLVLEPALLLLDEPTAGLDPVAADELRRLVEAYLRRSGASCVWATHDLHSVPSNVERVVLLSEGKVLFDGSRAEGLSEEWLRRGGLAVSRDGEGEC